MTKAGRHPFVLLQSKEITMGRNTIAKKSFVVEDGLPTAVQFTFSDGVIVTVEPGDFPEFVQAMQQLSGISHTLGDTYSKTSGPAEARQQLQSRIDAWINGEWAMRGDASTDLALALSRISKTPLEDVIAKLADLPKAKRDALPKKAQVKLELMKIKLERAEAAASGSDDALDF